MKLTDGTAENLAALVAEARTAANSAPRFIGNKVEPAVRALEGLFARLQALEDVLANSGALNPDEIDDVLVTDELLGPQL